MSLVCIPNKRYCGQQGISMLEVLIALVLLTTTLLGATALQLNGLNNNRSAYYRSQASVLAYDLADRIRINAGYALADTSRYQLNTASASVPTSTSCATTLNGCSDSQVRDLDLREWYENFFDVTGVGDDGNDYKPLLPGGFASVTTSGSLFSVTVGWQETDWNVGGGSNKADSTKSFVLEFNVSD